MIGFGIFGLGAFLATGEFVVTFFVSPILFFIFSSLLVVLPPFKGRRILGAVLLLLFFITLDFHFFM
ncbi:MAG: hypothetical protein IKC59_07670, partial [Clostridia bacterium]|nr:hypothetical protein [Clostridia bacterium]